MTAIIKIEVSICEELNFVRWKCARLPSPTQITRENINYTKAGIRSLLLTTVSTEINTQYNILIFQDLAFTVEQMDKNLVIASTLPLLSYLTLIPTPAYPPPPPFKTSLNS